MTNTQFNIGFYDNILLPNLNTIFSITDIKKVLRNVKNDNKKLIMSIFPVYKNHWINSKLKINNNVIYLSYNKNNDDLILPQSFKNMKIIEEDKNKSLEYNDYRYTIINNNITYFINWNAYSYLYILNMKDKKIKLDLLDYYVSLGIVLDGIRYHYLSSSDKSMFKGYINYPTYPNTTEDNFKAIQNINIYKFTNINLKSLLPNTQLDILKLFLERANCVLTGSTGVGKTSQIPKLLWWFNNYLDGYSFYSISRKITDQPYFNLQIDYNTTILSLPRKLLITSNAGSISKSLGFKEPNGSNIIIKFKGSENAPENNMNQNTKSPLFISVNQLTLNYIKKCNSLIIDEIHEHDTYALIIISIAYKLFSGLRNILLMTATLEDDLIRIKEYFKNIKFIHIQGDTLYNITEHIYPVLNYKDIIMKLIIEGNFKLGETLLIFQRSKNEVNKLMIKLSEELKTVEDKYQLYYDKAYSGIENLTTNVIKVIENNGKRNILIGTNILESSLTISNAKIVIDDCTFYMKYFRSGKVGTITKNMQIQRKGRVGRTQPGIYIASELIVKTKYKKIDNEYLWPYIIYGLKYNLDFKDFFILPTDMNRFKKSIDYLNRKGIEIKKKIPQYFNIYKSKICSQIEYLKLYSESLNTKIEQQFQFFDENSNTYNNNNIDKEVLTPNLINLIIKICNMKLIIKNIIKRKNMFEYNFQLENEFEGDSTNTIKIITTNPINETLNTYLIGGNVIQNYY